jgi:hypothetical protein
MPFRAPLPALKKNISRSREQRVGEKIFPPPPVTGKKYLEKNLLAWRRVVGRENPGRKN